VVAIARRCADWIGAMMTERPSLRVAFSFTVNHEIPLQLSVQALSIEKIPLIKPR
jgi:hypothetical protein